MWGMLCHTLQWRAGTKVLATVRPPNPSRQNGTRAADPSARGNVASLQFVVEKGFELAKEERETAGGYQLPPSDWPKLRQLLAAFREWKTTNPGAATRIAAAVAEAGE